jgi:hypothetical protein
MTVKRMIWPFSWLAIALILIFFSSSGGDASFRAGWLFLVWTIPFGVIWWFVIYDYVRTLTWLPIPVIQTGGDLIVVAAAFVFLFVFIPWIQKKGEKKKFCVLLWIILLSTILIGGLLIAQIGRGGALFS